MKAIAPIQRPFTAGIPLLVALGVLVGLPVWAQEPPEPPDVEENSKDREVLDPDVHLEIEARTYCGSTLHCYEVAEGDASAVRAGHDLRIIFRNPTETEHSLYVTTLDQADPSRENTPADAEIDSTDRYVAANDSDRIRFDVPEDASGLYLWCDIPGHEAQGMWMAIEFPEEPATTTATSDPNATSTTTAGTTTATSATTTSPTGTNGTGNATTNATTNTTAPNDAGGPTTAAGGPGAALGGADGDGGRTPVPALAGVVALGVAAAAWAGRRRR